MGIISKIFGLEHKGTIGIDVEKPFYFGGESVIGNVFLDVRERIQCNAIILKATGRESVTWKETQEVDKKRDQSHYHLEYETKTYSANHKFFETALVLQQINGGYILPGQYVFPFDYTLPFDLPGSCDMSSGLSNGEARIRYDLKATVEISGFFARDLYAKRDLIVRPPALKNSVIPSSSVVEPVRYLCCIRKGTCSIQATLHKSTYLPGEIAIVAVNVQNNTSVDIRKLEFYFGQTISLRIGSEKHSETKMKYYNCFPGIPAGKCIVNQCFPIQLAGTAMFPSVCSNNIRCEYSICIKCSIPWCSNVYIQMPVTIASPEATYNGWLPINQEEYNIPLAKPVS